MSARVMLFADFGKGPRKVGILRDLSSDRERREAMEEFAPMRWAPPGARDFYRHAMHTARRWWLVECESAEAGRQAIAFAVEHVAFPDSVHGRILASGANGAKP